MLGRMGRDFGRMGATGGSGWHFASVNNDIDFANNRAFPSGPPTSLISVTRASSGTDLLPNSASGASFNSFATGVARVTPGFGLLVEEARTNVVYNSTAPITQTTTALTTGAYTLWVNGSGTATPSGATATITGATTAVNGTPNTFTVTVGGTVTLTVSGSLNAMQAELGTFGTSLIPTQSAVKARNADIVTLTSPPTFGSAYTLFGSGTPYAPVASPANQAILHIDSGSANERTFIQRNTVTAAAVGQVIAGGVTLGTLTSTTWTQATFAKLTIAVATSDQASAFAGNAPKTATGSGLPVTPTVVRIGQSISGAGAFNGHIARIALWPTQRLPNAIIQNLSH